MKTKPLKSSSDHYDAVALKSSSLAKKREEEFRSWFCDRAKHYSIWYDRSEPGGYGQKSGKPDIEILLRGELLPIELKIAICIEDGRIRMSEIRPAQINWHRDFAHHYGRSYFMAGLRSDKSSDWGFVIVRSEIVTGALYESSSRSPKISMRGFAKASFSALREFDVELSRAIAEADKLYFAQCGLR